MGRRDADRVAGIGHEWRPGERGGFTLIEIMVAVTIMIILLGAVFALNFRIGSMWTTERGRSQMQQNFRFATDHITEYYRQAVTVISPDDNSLSDTLAFEYRDANDGNLYAVSYEMSSTLPHKVMRTVQLSSGGTATTQAVTEGLTSLASLHFVRTGARVVIMMVAEYDVFGTARTISYTTQTYARNYGSNIY
jgi:prepilin-type N-terminal cleavage/methylation domain-containing protein